MTRLASLAAILSTLRLHNHGHVEEQGILLRAQGEVAHVEAPLSISRPISRAPFSFRRMPSFDTAYQLLLIDAKYWWRTLRRGSKIPNS